jgi:prepilin-type N-terminal cleavage/methylation domain-containing protein
MNQTRHPEGGFTLVEVMIAIIVLLFGLMAVSNLFVTASQSNGIANQGSEAATLAAQQLEILKGIPYNLLAPSGSLTADQTTGCATMAPPFYGITANYTLPVFAGGGTATPYQAGHCFYYAQVPGVGLFVVRWQISAVPAITDELFIQVQAQGLGALGFSLPGGQARTTALYSTLRACVDTSLGCP